MSEQQNNTHSVVIDDAVYDLYDEYCHGRMDRREFLQRCGAITVAGVSIKPVYTTYASPGGTSGEMQGYLVLPEGEGPFPAVIVIHENRGLNPYIEDVARRFGTMGFVALAPDGLYPVGGYPGNDDDGRELQKSLDQGQLRTDMLNSARFLMEHEASNGKLGAVGFCWGGSAVNYLAVEMGEDLAAGVPFYGGAPASDDVPSIAASMMIQSASDDERVNAQWPEFETALQAHGKDFIRHLYPGTRHGFHNNSTPRFNEAQAAIAEERTVSFFTEHLSA